MNGTIYYNGTQENHYLYALNTSTDSISTLWDGNLWYPIAQGDYIYYMDVEIITDSAVIPSHGTKWKF